MRMLDLTGQRFGRWTVTKRGPNTAQGQARWHCRCECGGRALLKSIVLRRGLSRSCGCLHRESVIARSTKHGHATAGVITPTYWSWAGMIQRCTNPKHKGYASYGGRGVTVCERWLTFANFLADMGEKPHGGSLDRRDNEKGYTPENCRWATWRQQARNKRNNRLITLDGETRTLSGWAERLGVTQATLSERLEKWDLKDALTWPKIKRPVK